MVLYGFNKLQEKYYMKFNYYCRLCDRTIDTKQKRKHLNSQTHNYGENSIICMCYVEDPHFSKVEEILKKNLISFEEDYIYGFIRCRFALVFDNLTITFNQPLMCSKSIKNNKILRLLFSKICYHIIQGHKF